MTPSPNVATHFVLTYLDVSKSLDTAGVISNSLYNPAFVADCVATRSVPLAMFNELFQISIDGFDISAPNAVINDDESYPVKYYVNYPLATDISTMTFGSDAHVITNHMMLVDSYGTTLTDQTVKTDFIRFLAYKLFNTPLATDLFLNMQEMETSSQTAFDDAWETDIISHIAEVSIGGTYPALHDDGPGSDKYCTNQVTSTNNICRELYMQMASKQPSRFSGWANTLQKQSLPFMLGDSISFRVTMSPYAGQQLFGGPPIGSRSYGINLVAQDNEF